MKLFGEKATFAIECEPHSDSPLSLSTRFGALSIWIGGHSFGSSTEYTCSYNIPYYFFDTFLRVKIDKTILNIDHLTPLEVLRTAYQIMYCLDHERVEDANIRSILRKIFSYIFFAPDVSGGFDKGEIVVLAYNDNRSFVDLSGGAISFDPPYHVPEAVSLTTSVSVESGTFESVVKQWMQFISNM